MGEWSARALPRLRAQLADAYDCRTTSPRTHVLDDDEWDVDQAIWQAAHDATPARRRGRPAVGGQISVSFAPEVLAAVDDAAASEGVSRSEFIRRATRDALPPPERRARLREQA